MTGQNSIFDQNKKLFDHVELYIGHEKKCINDRITYLQVITQEYFKNLVLRKNSFDDKLTDLGWTDEAD